ncbi:MULTISPECIES: 2Fe-2S iron-sulfur cluster-binding protein [Spongiibacter]|uniref:2Fe-2S iron-sulfur cluster-binding protein n=1 Tax=Spongiibacter TaxID=630749 RepID=UPI0003B65DAE|nr:MULTISPECIES: 2Fe-2S iron-sulfur cluster-binding protein [Spongiibacter]MAY37968.1 hypothetical protein [Spongiibacter sp.]MBI58525.1 hypothetical protein [Spongiibacter sp.]MBO6752674.1 2Fe-2S iron-sulfur cluster binding domain-containing protein [Spongiibacter sp.]MBU70494.1 hypothetical protein [Spongiibacter sp.]|tara:strand:+ start:23040 stop:23342 length:303 start_codon:yes stop_codon:yes gene_type:complete
MRVLVTDRQQQSAEYLVEDFQELFDELSSQMKIDALCGGCCSCATCHVYLDEPEVAVPAEDQEKEVLEGLIHHRDNSRLLCQLEASQDITELKIQIAPAE